MHSVNIKCYNEIAEYCKSKGITDVDLYINDLVYKAYMIDKYGMIKASGNKLINIGLNEIEINKDEPKITNNNDNFYNE